MLDWLLDSRMILPGQPGLWPVWMALAFLGSNLALAAVDFGIPFLIARYWKYRSDGVTTGQFWRAVGFFPLLGVTRLVRLAALRGLPPLWTIAADLLAAAACFYCLSHLAGTVKYILQLPSRSALQSEMAAKEALRAEVDRRRERVQAELDEANRRIVELSDDRQAAEWWRSRQQALSELGHMFDAP